MNAETLDRANRIRCEMADAKKMLNIAESNKAVEISFNLGGFGCRSNECPFLSPEEVANIKSNITGLILMRTQARLDELQNEFDNL